MAELVTPRHSGRAPGRSASGSPVGRKYLMLSRVGAELVVGDPHRLDPHADVDVVDWALLDEVHDRDVGAVEQDRRGHVRDLHALAVERHVDDAELVTRADVRQLDLLGRRLARAAGRRRGAGRRPSRPAARSPRIFLCAMPRRKRLVAPPGGVRVREPAGVRTQRTGSTSRSDSGSVISAIRRLGHQAGEVVDVALALLGPRGSTRMPVRMRRSSRRRRRGASRCRRRRAG